MQDYFEVLGLRRTASDREIREAYRRLAKMYHPDSNPDPEAGRRMQAINQAKAVLFDPVKREEHRAKLGLREKLTAQRLREIRRRDAEVGRPLSERVVRVEPSTVKSGRAGRTYVFGGIAIVLIVSVVVLVSRMTAHAPLPSDPVAAIISRYHQLDRQPMDTMSDIRLSHQQMDTMSIARESPEDLRQHGDLYFAQLDFSTATKYYEVYLRNHEDDAMAGRLAHCYFKRHRYAEALEVIRDNVHDDSNRIAAYYETGVLFLHAEKPFDARDAFAAAVIVSEKMKRANRHPPEQAERAKRELAKLE